MFSPKSFLPVYIHRLLKRKIGSTKRLD